MFDYDLSDDEFDDMMDKVYDWGVQFSKSKYYKELTQEQQDESEAVIMLFTEYCYQYLGSVPEEWEIADVQECCIEVLPAKISMSEQYFRSIAPVLSKFFKYLDKKKLLDNALPLSEHVETLNDQILSNSKDSTNWGPAKRFVMAAMDAGVDVTDNDKMQDFLLFYQFRQSALMDGKNVEDEAEMKKYIEKKFGDALESFKEDLPAPIMKKVGRNDPCPCGSGKKFKKCCIDKEKDKNVKETENKNGIPSAKVIEKMFRDAKGIDDVSQMKTEDIIKKLSSMKITFNEQNFKDLTKKYISVTKLADEKYITQNKKLTNPEIDLVYYSINELWQRLIPEQYNLEMLDDAITDGYECFGEHDFELGLEKWALAWKIINHITPKKIQAIEDFETLTGDDLFADLEEWLQNYEYELANAGIKDKDYFRKRIQFCNEFITRFPKTDKKHIIEMNAAIAESHFALGEDEKAEKIFIELMEENPKNPWVYIYWGDIYSRSGYVKRSTENLARARNIYEMGLKNISKSFDRLILQDRLEEL